MNPEKQRIAIAEACGWTDFVFRGIHEPRENDIVGRHPSCTPKGQTGIWSGPLPDYLHDLNAMHEAESLLDTASVDQRSLYYDYLLLIAADPGENQDKRNFDWFKDKFEREWAMLRTSAAQRAEAFLRTIGKWEDETK